MKLRTPALRPLLLLFAAFSPAAASAQSRGSTATVVAVPVFATAKVVDTDAGTTTWGLANQIAGLVEADLKSTGSVILADSKKLRIPSFPEVTAPSYPAWRGIGAKLLLSGFVNARSDGRLTIGCYVYDVQSGRELARQGFAVAPDEWRRAAHRCADAVYVKATGSAPIFDSRIAYVAQSGREESPSKRLAIMDFDGGNHRYLTDGNSTVITPSWSPNANRIAYTSFANGRLQARVAEIASEADRPLVAGAGESFAPAFSPDGRTVALSVSDAGNSDVVTVDSSGGFPRRLTTSPAIDTSPSWSPDGARIAFVSDRSGTPQIYVMDSDGSNQRRISFGRGEYGAPAWSPEGELIAFTRVEGTVSRIGTMRTDGSEERIVTAGPADEQPAWSPDGRLILFQHGNPATRRPQLETVPVQGGETRAIATPQGATDPSWRERKE